MSICRKLWGSDLHAFALRPEWGEIFGDSVVATALLDRLLHHAVVIQIEGASYRLRGHADLIPEHIRENAPITPPPPPKKRGRPKRERSTDA